MRGRPQRCCMTPSNPELGSESICGGSPRCGAGDAKLTQTRFLRGHDGFKAPKVVMRGLDLRIHPVAVARAKAENEPMQGGWVYIMTNRPNGTLYVGVTSDLARRLWEHREGVADGFTKKYH